jgi:hypothetical protein
MSQIPLREGAKFPIPLREERYHVPLGDRVKQSYNDSAALASLRASERASALLQSADRLEHLPLLLAGPILRRTDSDGVTVWVALKAPREVTLKVYATDANGSIIGNLLLEGKRSTLPIGKHLHIVAVTAKPIGVGEGERGRSPQLNSRTENKTAPLRPCTLSSLEPGQIYAYDLSFGSSEHNLAQALTAKLFPQVTVSYFEHQLPTFAMPPEDLNDLRLAHGSCRKLHGGGSDALPILDDLIEHYAKEANARLHQLFLTGDQIYGDDVADPLLWLATEVGDTLLGWEENLPLYQTATNGYEYKKPSELKPGQRTDIARDYCGFTAMLINSPQKAKSHLFSVSEYFATYLLVWSPILWPDRLPEGKEVYKEPKQARQWDAEASHLTDCMSQLWKIRRALANVPTYMIFDEAQRMELEKGNVYSSDVGDAWNLNEVALSKLLNALFQRRRVVVVLSGDIHYGATTRLSYWFHPHDQGTGDSRKSKSQSKIQNPKSKIETSPIPSNARVLVQLTASAFKNGELKTHLAHTKVKSLAPELPQNWAGWNEPPQLIEIQATPEKVQMLDVEVPATGPVLRLIKGVRGNWNFSWEIALKDHKSLPNWQYYVEWIKREKATLAPWIGEQMSSAPFKNKNATAWLTGVGNLVSLLWRNQWLQEGEEVIGRNNFGVVSLKWPENNEETKAVIHDAYWQPPWQPNSVVYSRYIVLLRVDNPPPPPRIAPRIVPPC